ncbi:MAG: threonylcarbamoyl-AMP synthase [Actinomycetota bacterium]|nr:MAG: threonylcarbamoyl-AMP synthase [Actinomycetota bacterium]
MPDSRSRTFDCAVPGERERGLQAAASVVRAGGLAVVPTDVAYGLATDAFTAAGLRRLRTAKARGRDLPVPVLVGTLAGAEALASGLRPAAHALMTAFWPGPLTLVALQQPSLDWAVGDGRTVSLRMPLHPVALELLARTGPLAVTGANRAGLPVPTTMAQAREQLDTAVEVYLDGGPALPGGGSAVVDVTGPEPRLLRPGPFAIDLLREVVPTLQDVSG